jgi:hypothetical protein
VDVADPRDARAGVSALYLLPRGVYRAKAVNPVPARGAGFFTDMSPSPRRPVAPSPRRPVAPSPARKLLFYL